MRRIDNEDCYAIKFGRQRLVCAGHLQAVANQLVPLGKATLNGIAIKGIIYRPGLSPGYQEVHLLSQRRRRLYLSDLPDLPLLRRQRCEDAEQYECGAEVLPADYTFVADTDAECDRDQWIYIRVARDAASWFMVQQPDVGGEGDDRREDEVSKAKPGDPCPGIERGNQLRRFARDDGDEARGRSRRWSSAGQSGRIAGLAGRVLDSRHCRKPSRWCRT